MSKVKPVVQGLWIGAELSLGERLCASSFVKCDNEFHLYVYNDLKGVPDGVQLKDANEIIPESEIFIYSGADPKGVLTGSYATFADWFRWKLLYERGGFYSDMDNVCLKRFEFDTDLVFGWQTELEINSNVLGIPAGHEIAKLLEELCDNPNKVMPYNSFLGRVRKWLTPKRQTRSPRIWGEYGGPSGLTLLLRRLNMLHLAKPVEFFSPVSWRKWKTIYDETYAKTPLSSRTYTVHLYNTLSKKLRVSRGERFPKGSLYEQLKARYL